VPTERIARIRGKQKRMMSRKLYPGYVFVEMELGDDGRIPDNAWFLIKETMGVGDFIGAEGKPTAMQRHEVDKMLAVVDRPEEEATVDVKFKKGDRVKIREGPFENFEGDVDEVAADKGKVKVIVEVFQRPTPLELEYWQIEQV
jgi:transcriptional antiterminator NusG